MRRFFWYPLSPSLASSSLDDMTKLSGPGLFRLTVNAEDVRVMSSINKIIWDAGTRSDASIAGGRNAKMGQYFGLNCRRQARESCLFRLNIIFVADVLVLVLPPALSSKCFVELRAQHVQLDTTNAHSGD